MKRILVALILSAWIAPAHNVTAATISFTSGWAGLSLDLVVDGGDTFGDVQKDHVIVLPQFDPSLGALSDVTFNLASDLYIGHEFLLVGFGTPILSAASSDYTLSIADLVTGTVFQKTFHNTAECDQGGGLCVVSNFEHGGEMYDDSVSVAPLAGYQGVGNFDLTLRQLTEITINPIFGAAEAGLVAGWSSGVLEVVYTYSVVPVPAAVWLFGSALGLLGWMRRKAT
jgi:hypothetical protein